MHRPITAKLLAVLHALWIPFTVIVVVLTLIARVSVGGWALFLFAIPYLIASAFHLGVHVRASRRGVTVPWQAAAAVASMVLFVCALLIQADEGGTYGGDTYLVFTALVAKVLGVHKPPLPAWWSGIMGILVFVPLVISWWLMLRAPAHLLGRALTLTVGTTVLMVVLLGTLAAPIIGQVTSVGGPPPNDCGADVTLIGVKGGGPPDVAYLDGTGVGSARVWVAIANFGIRSGHPVLTHLSDRRDAAGYRMDGYWFAAKDLNQPIDASIKDTSGQTLDVQRFDGAQAHAGHLFSLHLPRAGCYELEATWPDGSWRIPFAAGQ